MATVSGPAGKQTVRLLLDTGAAKTLLDPRTLRIVGAEPVTTRTLAGIGGMVEASEHRIESLTIGDLVVPLEHVVGLRLPSGVAIDGLLGLDALKSLRLEIDLTNRVVSLMPSLETHPETP
ncbi:hypothetical protein EON79_10370 [bacterium]|nr:MAG: hypothetical protein EON79_10370 [bacterium]